MGEEVEAQYVSVEDEQHLSEAALATLQDNGKTFKKHQQLQANWSCFMCLYYTFIYVLCNTEFI